MGDPSACTSPDNLRTVALFPGAFRPPHINHYETVRWLVERPDVDEVVVIISNRPRTVPGSSLLLDVDASRQIWNIYLRDLHGVRVETAGGSAVAVATERVRSGQAGDRFLLVFGDPDLAAGRKRFGKAMRYRPEGVEAFVERGAPNPRPVRATEMRGLLVHGEGAFNAFRRSLPDHLSAADQRLVWTICRQAMIDRHTLTAATIAQILEANGLAQAGRITPAGRRKFDQVYRVTLESGEPVFIKYANDAAADPHHDWDNSSRGSSLIGPERRKPRRRLKAEREALKWLRRHVESPALVPKVICYDRTARVLVLSGLCVGGHRLADSLLAGVPNLAAARAAGEFLAATHKATVPAEPFWDDHDTDRRHWHTALTQRTTPPSWADQWPTITERMEKLADASSAAANHGFCHLDYSPDNILCGRPVSGVIDFERSATFGDPAFDLGTQIGHYLAAGFWSMQPSDSRAMIEACLDGYSSSASDLLAPMIQRVAAFAAATALRLSPQGLVELSDRPSAALLKTCTDLLSLLDEPDARLAKASLIGCVAGHSSAGKRNRRTVRRRSLKPVNPLGLWEGWLVEHAQIGLTTVAVHGGQPLSMIDLYIDGTWVATSELDSVGSATIIIATTPGHTRIEVADLEGSVLEAEPIHPF